MRRESLNMRLESMCISCSKPFVSATKLRLFTEMWSLKTCWSTQQQNLLKSVTLGLQESSPKTKGRARKVSWQTMWLLDGTDPQNYFWETKIMENQLIYGPLVAYWEKCVMDSLYFQETLRLISSIVFKKCLGISHKSNMKCLARTPDSLDSNFLKFWVPNLWKDDMQENYQIKLWTWWEECCIWTQARECRRLNVWLTPTLMIFDLTTLSF